jgi:hypothetical protein
VKAGPFFCLVQAESQLTDGIQTQGLVFTEPIFYVAVVGRSVVCFLTYASSISEDILFQCALPVR